MNFGKWKMNLENAKCLLENRNENSNIENEFLENDFWEIDNVILKYPMLFVCVRPTDDHLSLYKE